MSTISASPKLSFTALHIVMLIALLSVGESTRDSHPVKVRYNRKVVKTNGGKRDPSVMSRLVRKLSGAGKKPGIKKVVRASKKTSKANPDYYLLYKKLIEKEQRRKKQAEARKKRRAQIRKLRKLRALRKKLRIERRKKLRTLRKKRHIRRLLALLKKRGFKYPSKVRYPEACSCKALPRNSNAVCYTITNAQTYQCQKRPCGVKYVCVPGINTGLTCYRRLTKTKVISTGNNYCKVKPHKSIMVSGSVSFLLQYLTLSSSSDSMFLTHNLQDLDYAQDIARSSSYRSALGSRFCRGLLMNDLPQARYKLNRMSD